MRTIFRKTYTISLYLFAVAGLILVLGFFAVKFGFTNTEGIIDAQQKSFMTVGASGYTLFPLAHTPEWISFREAIVKDKEIIEQVSKEIGVEPRTLVAILVPEQMRLFHSNRPTYKKIFEPLKILGSQTQFSWGIFGIKDETAKAVEEHLASTTSPFYLGATFEHALDFTTADSEQERFARITDQHNHVYGYLYAALFVKQITSQWEKAGFPITNKPEILATLWNLGFDKSKPNADPKSGGAPIDIEGTTYSFGALANAFYTSDELVEYFPIQK